MERGAATLSYFIKLNGWKTTQSRRRLWGNVYGLAGKKGAEMGGNEQAAAPSEVSGAAVSTLNLHILAKTSSCQSGVPEGHM